MLIPSSWCHIESRQSHRWAQRRQTARTTTLCSRSTCSTARGSSSPARVKYFERVVDVDIKHCNFPPESFRHFNVDIFNKKALNLNFSMLALPIIHQTPGNWPGKSPGSSSSFQCSRSPGYISHNACRKFRHRWQHVQKVLTQMTDDNMSRHNAWESSNLITTDALCCLVLGVARLTIHLM